MSVFGLSTLGHFCEKGSGGITLVENIDLNVATNDYEIFINSDLANIFVETKDYEVSVDSETRECEYNSNNYDIITDCKVELGMQEYIDEWVDKTYYFFGYVGQTYTYIPIPYGMKYPVNKYFDGATDYNFVEEVYINGTKLEKDADWREATASEGNGFVGAGESIINGLGANKGFANMVILIGTTVEKGDEIRMKVKQRRLLSKKVTGIRLGNAINSTHWGDEVNTRNYNYPTNNGTTDNASKLPNTCVYWNYPSESKYLICIGRLITNPTGGYSGANLSESRMHQGIAWRINDTIESGVGLIDLAIKGNKNVFKLAVFDKTTGALSDWSQETIIRKWNSKWSGTAGPLEPNLVLR